MNGKQYQHRQAMDVIESIETLRWALSLNKKEVEKWPAWKQTAYVAVVSSCSVGF